MPWTRSPLRILLGSGLSFAMLATTLLSGSTVVGAATVVSIAPGSSIQAVIDANPAGTTFRLLAGVHARQQILPKDGTTLLGDTGAVLDGFGMSGPAIAGTSEDVTIEGLEIRNYASRIQRGAVQMTHPRDPNRLARNWTLHDVYIHHNGARGVTVGDDSVVSDSRIVDNGQLGIGGRKASAVLITGNEIARNNTENFTPGWEAGGVKISGSTGVVVEGNHVHDNNGPGLWCDVGCDGALFRNNLVEGHVGEAGIGIFIEISRNAKVEDNTVVNCGWPDPVWLWGAGVLVAASDHVDVENNTIIGCDVGIGLIQQDRYLDGQPRLLGDITVQGNRIVNDRDGFRSKAGVVSDVADSTVFDRAFSFSGNQYVGEFLFLWDGGRYSFDGWKAAGFGGGSLTEDLTAESGQLSFLAAAIAEITQTESAAVDGGSDSTATDHPADEPETSVAPAPPATEPTISVPSPTAAIEPPVADPPPAAEVEPVASDPAPASPELDLAAEIEVLGQVGELASPASTTVALLLERTSRSGTVELLDRGRVVEAFDLSGRSGLNAVALYESQDAVEPTDLSVRWSAGVAGSSLALDAIIVDGHRLEAEDHWATGVACGFDGWFAVETVECNGGGFDFSRPLPAVSSRALGSSPPRCGGLTVTIRGTSGRDTILGTPGDDVIWAGAGDDAVFAGAGNDTICAGAGDDSVDAGAGDDRVFAGNGDDAVLSSYGDDTVRGGRGGDSLYLGDGADFAHGGPDDDVVHGGVGDDTLRGGTGVDILIGDLGDDACHAGGQIADSVSDC